MSRRPLLGDPRLEDTPVSSPAQVDPILAAQAPLQLPLLYAWLLIHHLVLLFLLRHARKLQFMHQLLLHSHSQSHHQHTTLNLLHPTRTRQDYSTTFFYGDLLTYISYFYFSIQCTHVCSATFFYGDSCVVSSELKCWQLHVHS
jgi:hypothetical protein